MHTSLSVALKITTQARPLPSAVILETVKESGANHEQHVSPISI
jgi:hypothetical protein